MPPEYVLTGRSAGLGQVEPLEQLVRPLARLLARQVVELADHLDVLEAGQVLVDRRVLAGEADLGAQRIRVAHHVQPGDARAAAIGLQQRGQDAYRGGLSSAVWTQEAENRAGRRGEVHSAQRAYRPVRLLEPLHGDRVIAHSSEASESSSPQMVWLPERSRYGVPIVTRPVAGVSRLRGKTDVPFGRHICDVSLLAPALLAATFVLAAPAQAQVMERGTVCPRSAPTWRTTGRRSACATPSRPSASSTPTARSRSPRPRAAVDLTGGHHAVHECADAHARQGVLHARRVGLRVFGHGAAELEQERGLDGGPLRQRGPGRLRHQLGVRPRLQGRLRAARRLRGREPVHQLGLGQRRRLQL